MEFIFSRKMFSSLLALAMLILLSQAALAAPEAPGFGGQPGGSSSTAVSYTGAAVISSSETKQSASFTSTVGGENALLVSGGESTLTDPTVTKSGDESDESADFYGTNAAILVYNDAVLNLEGGSVTTSGSHANGVFAYGSGVINISKATIKTSANNSGGIMVTGGGTLAASDLTVETNGNSSAAIRSDRGGGTLTVDGGSYTTHGTGSPAVYSTADITVQNASLTATASEGVVVEGANSVTLENTVLTDTNNTLNGQSETYKNIFLYQSQSGDAAEGISYFTATDSTITTNQGDTFYVTNTSCVITLSGNTFTNNSGDFLRAESAAWGTDGSNGADVTLNMTDQTVSGDIVIDDISTLALSMTDGSYYRGAVNSANQASFVAVTLDADSVWVLTDNTYVDQLTNADSKNSNIYLNGYSLYVGGEKADANENAAPDADEDDSDVVSSPAESANDADSEQETEPAKWIWIAVAVLLLAAAVTTVGILLRRRKK